MIKRLFVLLSLSALLQSCAPRGENRSVDEVLRIQRERYLSLAAATKVKGEAQAGLGTLQTQLGELVLSAASAVPTKSQEIAATLTGLSPHAGFTVRPALTELIDQYRVLGSVTDTRTLGSAQVKLLVARTYNLMASELETTKLAL